MEWVLMPLRRYAEFSGRSRRTEFWAWQLFHFVVYIFVSGLSGAFLNRTGSADLSSPGMVINLLYFVFWLATLVPTIAVTVRRLHDTDRSGAWWFVAPFPPYPTAALIIFAVAIGLAIAGAAASTWIIPGAIVAVASLIGWVTLLVFLFQEGTRGANRFGEDPKGPGVAEVFA